MRRVSSLVFVITLFLLLLSTLSVAQVDRATLTGSVTDPTGAVIPGVDVLVTNVDTGVQTTTKTNETGLYSVPNLPIGRYSVLFEKQGFRTVKHSGISLSATQVGELNTSMEVGGATEAVNVVGDIPLLQTETVDFGTNLKADAVNALPLSIYGGGRFIENFAVAITPGYSPISSPYGAVVNGGQWFSKDFTIDGTSGTANIRGNSMSSGPTMEAVQEVQAQTSGLDAQSAITGGGVMSFSIKSGTNKFHGSAFNYGHNELLDANTWTNDAMGLPKGKARAWDFGGSVGGPIIKDKTFFFGAIERVVQNDFRLGSTAGATVPTEAFRNGDFSALLGQPLCDNGESGIDVGCESGTPISVTNNDGQPVQLRAGMIFDPLTGNQFTNNIIPADRISSVSKQINEIYKNSYAPEINAISDNLRIPMAGTPTQTPIQSVVKLDHVLSNKDQLSGSWIYNRRPRTLMDSGGVWAAGTTDGGPFSASRRDFYKSHEYRVREAHTFSPSVLNVFNVTYNWDKQYNSPSASGDWSQTLGFGASSSGNFPLISFGGNVNGHGMTFLGNQWQNDWSGATFILGNNVTWTKGRHNFTFGGDFTARQVNTHKGQGLYSFNFEPNTTGAPETNYGSYVGFGYASFLLGDVNTASVTTPANFYGRRKEMALFAQDSWKLRQNLTVNLGLRWNYNLRFHEKYGHWASFDLNAIDPNYGIPGRLVYAKGGSDSFEKKEYLSNFGPQLGLAYSPWQKTVVRASIGMIYQPAWTPNFNGIPNGFDPGYQGTNQAPGPFQWDKGYTGVFQPGSQAADPTFLFPVTSVDPRALRLGYSVAMNFGVQYSITPNMRLDVSYVGNRGHRLSDTTLAYNAGSTSELQRLAALTPQLFPDPNDGNHYLNGFNNYIWDDASAAQYGVKLPYPGFWGPVLAAIAPYPQLAQAASNYWWYPNLLYVGLPKGQSYYNSMVIDVAKRSGRGLTMDMSYTLSRQEGNSWSAQQENNGYYTPIQDFSNPGVAAHALTGYDQTHVIKGYISYELPFGKGRRWGADSAGIVNHLIGGWTLGGTFLYYSGQPMQIGASNPYWPQWGNIYPNYNLANFHGPNNPSTYRVPQPGDDPIDCWSTGGPNCYMSPTVASNPAYGQLGKGPGMITELRCPGQANENLSVLKNFEMGSDGRYKLSFRTEFYNAFNRHYYYIQGCAGSGSASIGSSDFGLIRGVMDNPRTGQFGLRFEF